MYRREDNGMAINKSWSKSDRIWSIVNMKSYDGGKQFNSKADLWEAIKTTK